MTCHPNAWASSRRRHSCRDGRQRSARGGGGRGSSASSVAAASLLLLSTAAPSSSRPFLFADLPAAAVVVEASPPPPLSVGPSGGAQAALSSALLAPLKPSASSNPPPPPPNAAGGAARNGNRRRRTRRRRVVDLGDDDDGQGDEEGGLGSTSFADILGGTTDGGETLDNLDDLDLDDGWDGGGGLDALESIFSTSGGEDEGLSLEDADVDGLGTDDNFDDGLDGVQEQEQEEEERILDEALEETQLSALQEEEELERRRPRREGQEEEEPRRNQQERRRGDSSIEGGRVDASRSSSAPPRRRQGRAAPEEEAVIDAEETDDLDSLRRRIEAEIERARRGEAGAGSPRTFEVGGTSSSSREQRRRQGRPVSPESPRKMSAEAGEGRRTVSPEEDETDYFSPEPFRQGSADVEEEDRGRRRGLEARRRYEDYDGPPRQARMEEDEYSSSPRRLPPRRAFHRERAPRPPPGVHENGEDEGDFYESFADSRNGRKLMAGGRQEAPHPRSEGRQRPDRRSLENRGRPLPPPQHAGRAIPPLATPHSFGDDAASAFSPEAAKEEGIGGGGGAIGASHGGDGPGYADSAASSSSSSGSGGSSPSSSSSSSASSSSPKAPSSPLPSEDALAQRRLLRYRKIRSVADDHHSLYASSVVGALRGDGAARVPPGIYGQTYAEESSAFLSSKYALECSSSSPVEEIASAAAGGDADNGEEAKEEEGGVGYWHSVPSPGESGGGSIARRKLYGGAQYHRLLESLHSALLSAPLKPVSADELALLTRGMGLSGGGCQTGGPNVMSAVANLCRHRMDGLLRSWLDAVAARVEYVLGARAWEVVRYSALTPRPSSPGTSGTVGASADDGTGGEWLRSDEVDRIEDELSEVTETAYANFVRDRVAAAHELARDDLNALVRYVSWEMVTGSNGSGPRSASGAQRQRRAVGSTTSTRASATPTAAARPKESRSRRTARKVRGGAASALGLGSRRRSKDDSRAGLFDDENEDEMLDLEVGGDLVGGVLSRGILEDETSFYVGEEDDDDDALLRGGGGEGSTPSAGDVMPSYEMTITGDDEEDDVASIVADALRAVEYTCSATTINAEETERALRAAVTNLVERVTTSWRREASALVIGKFNSVVLLGLHESWGRRLREEVDAYLKKEEL